MSFLTLLAMEDLEDLAPIFRPHAERLGFVPNGFRVAARNREVLRAYHAFTSVSLTGGRVPLRTKLLAAIVASAENGCVYCQSHLALGLSLAGVPAGTVQAALAGDEGAEGLSPAEQAAVRFACAASAQPNRSQAADLEALHEAIGAPDAAEIVSIVCQFQYLSAINAMIGSRIEPEAHAHALTCLPQTGWRPAHHAPGAHLPEASTRDLDQDCADRLAHLGSDHRPPTVVTDTPDDPEVAAVYGFTPNAYRALALHPALAHPHRHVVVAIQRSMTVPQDLVLLARLAGALARGSRYGLALAWRQAGRRPRLADRLSVLGRLAHTDVFTPVERLVMTFAFRGAHHPSDLSVDLYDDLKAHFDERQIVDLALAVAWDGYIQRWADIFDIDPDGPIPLLSPLEVSAHDPERV